MNHAIKHDFFIKTMPAKKYQQEIFNRARYITK